MDWFKESTCKQQWEIIFSKLLFHHTFPLIVDIPVLGNSVLSEGIGISCSTCLVTLAYMSIDRTMVSKCEAVLKWLCLNGKEYTLFSPFVLRLLSGAIDTTFS